MSKCGNVLMYMLCTCRAHEAFIRSQVVNSFIHDFILLLNNVSVLT